MNLTALLEKDTRISRRLRIAEQPGIKRTIAAILAHSGDSWFWFIALGLLWWYGTPYWKERAQILLISAFVTATLVTILKFTIRRRRPEGEWGKMYRVTDPHSFPSGHAARAILIGIVCTGIGPVWLGVILLVWGSLVGLARVTMGVHYLSDVVGGWLVGITAAVVTLIIALPTIG
jgi:undecaprenyl-diphosphatase